MKKYVSLYFLFFMCLNLFGQGREITYTEGNTKLKGYLAIPESAGKKPGVVVLHAWMGLTEFEKNSADKLANLGYYALAADSFGENSRPKNTTEAGQFAGKYKNDRQTYRARIKAAIEELIKAGADPEELL